MKKEECIFCKIAKGEIPSIKIYENKSFFAIPDAHPVVPGHSLIISKKHFDNTLEMPANVGNDLLDAIKKTTEKLLEKHKSEGFNLANNNSEAAGQVVKHVHFHIIPRNKGDGLKFFA
ncbi:MAG: HIT domain-containing protein [Nanoarchaeota archaeon]|nr:HIT domain-containing protein [Nanoarchaeota archaeon]